MPVEYKIIPAYRLVVERVTGTVAVDELVAVARRVWADEAYDPTFRGLVDLTEADLVVKPIDVIAFGAFILASRKASTGRIALVVGGPREHDFGLLFRSRLGSSGNLFIFDDLASACEDLGVPVAIAGEEW